MHLLIFREYLNGQLRPTALASEQESNYFANLLNEGLRKASNNYSIYFNRWYELHQSGVFTLNHDIIEQLLRYKTLSYRNQDAAEGFWGKLPPFFTKRTEFYHYLFSSSIKAEYALLQKNTRAATQKDIHLLLLHEFYDEVYTLLKYLDTNLSNREQAYEHIIFKLLLVYCCIQVNQLADSTKVINHLTDNEVVYLAFPNFETNHNNPDSPESYLNDYINTAKNVGNLIPISKKQPSKKLNERNDLLTNEDVMALLKISKRTLENLRKEGKIPFSKKGKMVYYVPEHIQQYVKSGFFNKE